MRNIFTGLFGDGPGRDETPGEAEQRDPASRQRNPEQRKRMESSQPDDADDEHISDPDSNGSDP